MIKSVNPGTKIYGIIGYPLGHSLSPAMHNAAFVAAGIDAVYLTFPMKNVINIKYSMRQFSVQGLSVTIPHKINIRRSVDKIDPLALQIGSVNTVLWNKNGLLEGYNTDGPGAVQAIEESGFSIKGKKVLIIGSGGSARGIAFSLLEKGPSAIAVLARNAPAVRNLIRGLKLSRSCPELKAFHFPREKEKKIRLQFRYESILNDPSQLKEYDLIIQTTPLGMSGHSEQQVTPLSKEYLFSHQVLFDIVYNPEVTPLVKVARAKKLKTIPGYKMLLYQGARQFELFTGKKAPIEVMEKILKGHLKSSSK
ncbi:MAG: shikimate dehydrogenase [Leptospirales bacterium]